MVMVRADTDIKQRAYDWLAPKAHILREMEESDRHIAFVKENTDEILGCLLFSDYDGHNIFVHLALDDPKVCNKENIRLMFDYAFNQCKCSRMTAMCVNGYKRNERLLAGVGFVKEGIVRKSMKVDGKWIDAALYGILKEECTWV